MYVDTVGKVTVGVGHNLTAHKDKHKLPFKVKRLTRHPVKGGDTGIAITKKKTKGRAATKAEISNDIVDIAFNLGSFRKFVNFKHTIKGTGKFKGKPMSDRWKAAAKESYRPQVSGTRNSEVKQWLLDGAKAKTKKP